MLEVRKTVVYAKWESSLRDLWARARVERLIHGNPGDVKPVGDGVSELRIDYGPGYRLYYITRGRAVIILLAGGDKRTQAKDIATAIQLGEQSLGGNNEINRENQNHTLRHCRASTHAGRDRTLFRSMSGRGGR